MRIQYNDDNTETCIFEEGETEEIRLNDDCLVLQGLFIL